MKNLYPMAQTDRQTNRQTNRHGDSMTNSAKRAELVKILLKKLDKVVEDLFSTGTLSHLKSFIESELPPIRLFLMIIMKPLKRCVAKENYLIALLRNEARNNVLISGP